MIISYTLALGVMECGRGIESPEKANLCDHDGPDPNTSLEQESVCVGRRR